MVKQKEYILVINSGSATLKFKVFHQDSFAVGIYGIVEKIGLAGSFVTIVENSSNRAITKNYPNGLADHNLALKIIFAHLSHWQKKIKIIGHRVVHGGEEFVQPTLVTLRVLEKLKKYNQLAPLHNPVNLACIESCLKFWPKIKNIAVFDTAFYKTLPPYAYIYSIPLEYYQNYGIRRYGFHGISHQYVAEAAALKLKKPLNKLKLITCHLGSGVSLTAVKFGKAIETSMGFTPLEGLTMGTRSGDLDPSVAFFLMRHLNLSISEMEDILNKKSGLLGIFGPSNDLREIMTAAGYKITGYQPAKKFNQKEKQRAKLALKIYIYDIVRYIGSYATIMGGVDYIIFTAGTGERSRTIRSLVMNGIRKSLKKVKSLVIPTNEELMIAKQAKMFGNS